MDAAVADDSRTCACGSVCGTGTHHVGTRRPTASGRHIGRPGGTPLFCHDGTERPITRPKDDDEQERYYSGKKKDHTIKNVIIIDAFGVIRFLSATYAGRVHDKRIADECNYQLPEGSVLGQDSGFQGFVLPGVIILQPKKKPPKGKLRASLKIKLHLLPKKYVSTSSVSLKFSP